MIILPGGIIGSAKPVLEYCDFRYDSTDRLAYTYTGVNFGTPHPRRYIAVWVSVPVDDVTIGGVPATPGNAAAGNVELWIAHVPTGSTGTIVASRDAVTMDYGLIGVYSLTNIRSPVQVDDQAAGTLTPPLTVGAMAQQYGIVLAAARVNSGSPTFTAGAVEDFEQSVSGGFNIAVASGYASVTGNHDVTVTSAGLLTQLFVATFR